MKLSLLFWTFLGLELSLRIAPYLVKDPLKSLLVEAQRIPYSNSRTYTGFKGGVRILLPAEEPKDLVIVGDSIPFGTYVQQKDIFSSVLERALGISIANISVGSQSPPGYNVLLQAAAPYKPKAVLYCIFANDFGNPNDSEPDPETLYGKTLSTMDTFAQSTKQLTNLSLTYQLYKFLKQPASAIQQIPWHDEKRSLVFAPLKFWDERLNWNLPRVQQSVKANTDLIEKAFTMTRGWGSKFLVVVLPSKEMVFGPLIKDVPSPIHSPEFDRTYAEFISRVRNRGIHILDLTQKLRQEAQNGKKLFHTIDGHYDEKGHLVIARLLQSEVLNLLQGKKIERDSLEN